MVRYSRLSVCGDFIENNYWNKEIECRGLGFDPGREDPLKKEMATCSSILALENPMDRGAWRVTVHGVTRVRHDLAAKPSRRATPYLLPQPLLC